MNDLDLLGAEVLGGEAPQEGTAWWKWALGGLAAVSLGYFLVRDLEPAALVPRRVPAGSRPW